MADWVKCEAYTQTREPMWINLDHVAIVRDHENGSVIILAGTDGRGSAEFAVWDRADEIFRRRGRS